MNSSLQTKVYNHNYSFTKFPPPKKLKVFEYSNLLFANIYLATRKHLKSGIDFNVFI